MNDKTDFGFQEINTADKATKVAEVFHSVAEKYDVMNDFMSLGLHRRWKKFAIATADLHPGQRILDVAGGTGDLTVGAAEKVGSEGIVVLSDINASMLARGRDRVINTGSTAKIVYAQADAENLPFPDNYFDCVFIGFGLRNVTRKENALRSIQRVLKPSGKLCVLEFSKPTVLNKLYDAYSFSILPWLGEKIAGDRASYQYLAESIRRHPDQKTLQAMILAAGFQQCDYFNLALGIVALHRAYKS